MSTNENTAPVITTEPKEPAIDRPENRAIPASAPLAPTADSEGGKGGTNDASPPSPPSNVAEATDDTWDAMPVVSGDDVFQPAPLGNPVIEALTAKRLYRHALDTQRHVLTCPWASDHGRAESSEALYTVPSEAVPLGSFNCRCPKHQNHKISTLLKHLDVERQAARCKPLIRVLKGETHRVVAAAETLLAQRDGFYQSGGTIVRLRDHPGTTDVSTEQATEASLLIELSAASDWQKFDVRKEDWARCDVPPNIVSNLVKRQEYETLQKLHGIARQPYLRQPGNVLSTLPGYDAVSGIYAAFDPADFNLPEPTRANAHAAVDRLTDLLAEFEFASAADQSTAISAMLTAAIRSSLPVAPAFNITASSPGSGKSYLASVIAPFAGPGEARNISYPSTSEEATKVVLSLALDQPSVVCFDDMTSDWLPHGAMNRMLTSGTVTERVLGTNRVVTARASSFVMGTGNNIRPLRDMARRVASIYLLPQREAVATKEYRGRPADLVRARRSQYVTDALTIIATWLNGGGRRANVPNIAGYEEWSDLCRHSLIWLGKPDPATSLIEQITHDPDAEQLSDLLQAWRDHFGEHPTTVRKVFAHIENTRDGDLAAAIMELPCVERGHVNQSRFGRYLGRNKNRIVGGLQLVEAEHSERRAWAVKRFGDGIERVKVGIPQTTGQDIPERAWFQALDAFKPLAA